MSTSCRQFYERFLVGDLLSEIKNEKDAKTGKKSKIAEILEAMSAEERKDLIAALDDHGIAASKISRVLARRGVKLSSQVVSRYRRGDLATSPT